MIIIKRHFVAALGVCLLSAVGCQTVSAGPEVAALISNPGPDSHAEIQGILDEVLGIHVLIAKDALSKSSILVIQHSPPAGINDAAGGRNMSTPIRFQLITNGKDCWIVDQRDGTRHPLSQSSCVRE